MPADNGGLRVTVELPAAPRPSTNTDAFSLAGRRPDDQGEKVTG
jgi:hypothetical protein